MKRIIWVMMLSIGLLLVFWYPNTGQTEGEIPEVIINELAWAGSSISSSDEWIELYNTTDHPIDLAGWTLKKIDTDNGGLKNMLTIPANHVINPNGYFVIANYKAIDSMLAIDPDYKSSSVELHNTQLQVQLINTNDTIIDTAWDGITQPISHDPKTTLERNPDVVDGTIPANWHPSTKLDSIYFDLPNLGSPFEVNSPKPQDPPSDPIITSITPDKTPAVDDFVLKQIDGDHFAMTDGMKIKLQNGTHEIWATNWQILSPNLIIDIKFNLADAEAGNWDVVVINPNQPPAVLINALTITEVDDGANGNDDNNADIQISEIYPRPTTGANDEFIELYNAGETSVNLKGWKLDDQYPGGSAIYMINDDIILTPDQYLAFSKTQTKISLNDAGDYARLINPLGTEKEVTPNYGSADKGEAYAKFDGTWKWTLRPTPNAKNLWDNPTIIEDTDTDDDPDNLNANDITIQLDADDITNTSVLLNWQISLIGAIGELELYQSDNKTSLGKIIASPAITKSDLVVENLTPNTVYYFTLIGSYNADDIKSNQIKVTTEKSGSGSAVLGDTGSYKQIIFTEILPNPASGEEYIELFNPTDEPINLAGWKIQDASGRTYVITAFDLHELTIADTDSANQVLLGPNQYLLLEYPTTHIRLNNSGGEELQLMDADNNLIDEIYYDGTVKKGYAYVIAPNQSWFWSDELTPGAENDISFATIDENSDYYLVATGKPLPWQIIFWISVVISGILWSYRIYHEAINQNNQ